MCAHYYKHFQQGEATNKVLVDPFITELMSKVVLMDAGSWRRQEASWRSTTSGVSSLCKYHLYQFGPAQLTRTLLTLPAIITL